MDVGLGVCSAAGEWLDVVEACAHWVGVLQSLVNRPTTDAAGPVVAFVYVALEDLLCGLAAALDGVALLLVSALSWVGVPVLRAVHADWSTVSGDQFAAYLAVPLDFGLSVGLSQVGPLAIW